MNVQAVTAWLHRARPRSRFWPRLVSAELLKVRKRRGLVLATLVVTVVPMSIWHTLFANQEGPVGGVENFTGAMDLLFGMSVIAAILLGATLGTGDVGAGVFRELVVTGRSRLLLFVARMPAGLAILIPIVGAGFAVSATISTVWAGSRATGYAPAYEGDPAAFLLGNTAPSGGLLLESAGWLALGAAVTMMVALGVSSALGSRGIAIALLLGWFLLVMPLLLDPALPLGSARQGLLFAATDRLKPDTLLAGASSSVTMSLTGAVAVLIAWTVVPLALGAWRTRTRDA